MATLSTHAADQLEAGAKLHDLQLALLLRDLSMPPLPLASATKGVRAGAVPSLLQSSSCPPVPLTVHVFLPAVLAHAQLLGGAQQA